MRINRCRLLSPLLAIALLVGITASARGQVVRGTLTGPGGVPEPGVTVVLLDSAGFTRGTVLSSPAGYYGFVAPFAGHFRLQVLRVGFADWQTDPFLLHPDETMDLNAELPGTRAAAVDLAPTHKCEARSASGTAAAEVLAEARKVLVGASQFLKQSDYRFNVHHYAKVFDDGHMEVASDTADEVQTDFWPVKSLPVERLEAGGYIQGDDPRTGPTYYGPDADVLFSDYFLNGHCFEIAKGKKENAGLIGLHFKSSASGHLSDIEGDLWMDPQTLGLVRLEFGYTHLPDWAPNGSAGGVLDFGKLPSGYWTILKWRMWAPIPERFQGTNFWHFIGYAEEGGAITKVSQRTGQLLFSADSTKTP